MCIYNGTHYVGPRSGAHAVGPLWLVNDLTSYNEGRCAAHHGSMTRLGLPSSGGAGGAPLQVERENPRGR